jgi:ABC-type uncharacterized transport system auxiliary subunit
MIRALDFLRLAPGLALSVMLGACTHQDAASTASNKTDITQVTVGADGMSEVVIRAQRPAAQPIVLSQRKPATQE